VVKAVLGDADDYSSIEDTIVIEYKVYNKNSDITYGKKFEKNCGN